MTAQAKHTPGPWTIHGDSIGNAVRGADGFFLATLADDATDSVTEANARLIAAAPDLLAACEAAQPVLESLALGGEWIDSPGGNSVAADIRDLLRAAIAKARGGP